MTRRPADIAAARAHAPGVRGGSGARGVLRLLAAAGVAATAGAIVATESGHGQAPAPTGLAGAPPEAIVERRDETATQLEALNQDIRLTDRRIAEITAEIDGLGQDLAAINAELVSTAAGIQDLEDDLTATETRLAGLGEQESALRESLAGRRAVLTEVLGAAQRLGRRPPPAIVVRAEDALGAVRSAMVLAAVLPEVRGEAEMLASDLDALLGVRTQTEAELARMTADRTSLAEEQQRLALLLDEKNEAMDQSEVTLAAEQARAEQLAAQASTLEELIGALELEIESAREGAAASTRADALAPEDRPSVNDPTRLAPAIPFANREGALAMPVRGVVQRRFGEDDGFGGRSQGIVVQARAGAQVVAPADGWVAYAGPWRSYGEVLILDVGDGYHLVLAGMDRVDVALGQFVLAGEPIAAMGTVRLASAAAADLSGTQPVLYIELRQDLEPIDSDSWWSES